MNQFILDCGKCGSHVYNVSSGDYCQITHMDMVNLNIPNLSDGDTIIVENAHMRSREKNSLAQPFSYDQLRELYDNAVARNIEILLFPEQSTPTARKLAAFKHPELIEKDDENDVKAISFYLKQRPRVLDTLKRFNPIPLDVHYENNKHKFADRIKLTDDVNVARNQKYGIKTEYDDAITKWIKNNYAKLAENLADKSLCEFIGIEYDKKEKFKASTVKYRNEKLKHLYCFICTIMTPKGELRVRSDINLVPYWKYAKEVYFGITPYHRKAGVMSSNYKYHLRKSASSYKKSASLESNRRIEKLEDYELIVQARNESDKKLREIWRVLRKMIVEEGIR